MNLEQENIISTWGYTKMPGTDLWWNGIGTWTKEEELLKYIELDKEYQKKLTELMWGKKNT